MFAALLAVAAVGVAACAAPDADVTATRSDEAISINPDRPDEPTDPTTPTDPTDPDQPTDPTTPDNPMNECGEFPPGDFPYDPAKPPQCYDQFLVASLEDIQAYWRTIYSQVYEGEEYVELEGGIFPAYPERETTIPGCGTNSTAYEEIVGNAFYCGLGDFIAYDDANLLPELDENIGRAVIAVVMAHEWGHAIQGRQDALGRKYPTYNTEQQADCFAGAWAAHVARGEAEGLTFDNQDVIAGLLGMILVADPVGADEAEPGAHGSAFDRVRAFQDGYSNGALICAPYLESPTESTLMPFVDMDDAATGGNLPYDDLVTLVTTSLSWFWPELLAANGIDFTPPTLVPFPNGGPYPECEGKTDEDFPRNAFFCESTGEVMFDAGYAAGLHDNIGDFAPGYLIGVGYADAVQAALGSTFTGTQRALYNDCITGVWTRALFPGEPKPEDIDVGQISPGDLDEAVQAALNLGDADEDDDVHGTAFAKIEAFRIGVLNGLTACNDNYGG